MSEASDETFGLTMTEAVDRFIAEGFTAEFGAVEGGLVRCYSCRADIDPRELHVNQILRVEGASDPDDMVAVVAVTCPHCGTKGTLTLKYGPDASPEEADVFLSLEDDRRR